MNNVVCNELQNLINWNIIKCMCTNAPVCWFRLHSFVQPAPAFPAVHLFWTVHNRLQIHLRKLDYNLLARQQHQEKNTGISNLSSLQRIKSFLWCRMIKFKITVNLTYKPYSCLDAYAKHKSNQYKLTRKQFQMISMPDWLHLNMIK